MSRAAKTLLAVFGVAMAVFIPAIAFAASPVTTVGAVFTMSNATAGNELLVYDRSYDGSLSGPTAYSTHGTGTGGGLGNQGGLVFARANTMLLVVNAGSDEISVFRARRNHVNLLSKINSGGEMPVSIATHGNLVYVLNAGGNGNITGFKLSARGQLTPIAGSTQSLSDTDTAPAQISFNPRGTVLAVTEKTTNNINLYLVDNSGVAGPPTTFPSEGATPFGFAFDRRGHMIVSEAFGGSPGASALSSYAVSHIGPTLTTISASVPDSQTAACWVVVNRTSKFAYTTNFGSNTISSYAISRAGMLTLHKQVAGMPGAGPLDMAFSRADRFLYSLNGGDNSISGFKVGYDGSLTHIGDFSGLPASANGMAAQ
jgi:6-phosphogluconolactonase (cycloisomerase 2 family)